LAESDDEEVEVEEELELLVEHQRQESDHCILLISDDIGRKRCALSYNPIGSARRQVDTEWLTYRRDAAG
jgi:hypothetical protein